MDVSAPQPTTTTSAAATSGKSVISSDFETFLKMLTTQMENQDPLNPVDSSDFAVQLATFSGVEQQVRTNDLLTALGTQMGTSGMAEFAAWVGMEARVSAPAAYSGQPITIAPQPATLADRAQLVVLDANGAEVQRLEISVSDEPFVWTGLASGGIPLPDGNYSFQVESFADNKSLGYSAAEIYATVTEARLSNGETQLVLDSGTIVPASSITALRAP